MSVLIAAAESNFEAPQAKAKLANRVAALVRGAGLDYDGFNALCKIVRKSLHLIKPRSPKRLPKLLSEDALRAFYKLVDQIGNLQHQILLRLLFFTAVRVSELVNITVEDVDLGACKIFITRGKGDKDRYILFPDSFALALRAYLAANPQTRYLFESRHHKPYSTRRIQQIVQDYAAMAGITEWVHPHLFRHQMITWLTAQGLPDSAIQLISGHASKKSLEIYQHVALAQVEKDYQAAVKKLEL